MKTAFLAQVFSALLLAMAAIAQQPPGKIQEDSIGVLEGQVTIAMTGEVIRKAVVIARRTSSGGTYAKGPDSYSGTTDGEGKFRIESVVPGRYQLWSERQGFVRQIYIDDTGQSNLVTIVAGKGLKPITFKMMPQALITGRVLDEDGEPMPRATVTVLSKRHQQGKPILMRVTSVNANDIGEYRVPDLAQGRYWVSAYWREYAATVAAAPPDKPEEAYAATFFPSAKTESLAQVVEVTAGQELPGIDIRMRKSQVFRIRGKVLPTGDGQPAGLVLVRPIPRDQTFYLGYYGAPSVWSKKDGTFELTGVTPGSYSICAFTQASQDLLGKTNVEVSREAVENVVVPIGLATLKGNIRVVPAAEEDSVEKTPLDSVRMQFAPFQGFAFIYPNVMSKADGSFQIDNLGLEKYRVTVAGLPKVLG